MSDVPRSFVEASSQLCIAYTPGNVFELDVVADMLVRLVGAFLNADVQPHILLKHFARFEVRGQHALYAQTCSIVGEFRTQEGGCFSGGTIVPHRACVLSDDNVGDLKFNDRLVRFNDSSFFETAVRETRKNGHSFG